MLNLITSFYLTNPKRQAELNQTLVQNINNPHIAKIHLFLDNKEASLYLKKNFPTDKINIVRIGKQPLYSDLFSYANTLNGETCMIANSDVWLKELDLNLLKPNNIANTIYAITRHEYDMSCPLITRYGGSHDAFIFVSPTHAGLIKHLKFPQNVWGSENVVLYELRRLKYKLVNPCKKIVIVHEHRGEARDPNRKRINLGDLNGDGVYSVRSVIVRPSD